MPNKLLSIGIIFRDDIRCIERCLKALQPLRDAIPCELVMADTGSEDGSREIAEKYADILIDFPWINDFAAARNAVMDRCSGKWFLTVDTDEYLQPNISELVSFLTADNGQEDFGLVVVRSHTTYEMNDDYSDFMALRMARLAAGIRYVGVVHESLTSPIEQERRIRAFSHIILDHDGYVGFLNTEAGKTKRTRNLKLIRQRVAEDNKNLALRLELLDSAVEEPDFVELVRDSVKLLLEKPLGWDKNGPALLRTAIYVADARNFPERDEWIQLAWDWFPNSLFTWIDVVYLQLMTARAEKQWEECVQRGEQYMKAMEAYRAGANLEEWMYGVPDQASPVREQRGKITLVEAYCNTNRFERAAEILTGLDYAKVDPIYVAQLVAALQELQYKSEFDTTHLIETVWDGLSAEKPSKKRAEERLNIFFQVAGLAFVPENQEKEREKEDFHRPSYTIYLPLLGKCEVGAAAAILEADHPEKMEELLATVENWTQFPIHALRHMIERGARFPLRPLHLEVMDALASRLAADEKRFLPMVQAKAQICGGEDGQQLLWKRGLLLAAVRVFRWTKDTENAGEESAAERQRLKDGQELARMFAAMEKEFLPRCYAEEALCTENLYILPMMHRFGWYCVQAFDRLDADDPAGYVRLLREGLASCPEMTPMVEFLLDRLEERRQSQTAPELLELARQVRTVLAQYPADDPAVAALKQSAAYRQVRHLIEGPELNMFGGLSQ